MACTNNEPSSKATGPFDHVESVIYGGETVCTNQDTISGFAIIKASKGDAVYVRTHSSYTNGHILRDNNKRRLLVGSGTLLIPTTQYSAFYAYFSHHEIAPGNHHTLIFDTVKTNTDGMYSGITGVFPLDGVYGFIYTIRMGCHTAFAIGTFKIMRNNKIEGVSFIDVPCNLLI
ncbi:unnamed protein product [Mytilus coruscus]|uniref:C1q domain-containing protein n=1 Tax=Mytilus coruscus TaxID=42192 RepID=A0A6J8BP61_MYTCO|nr:unnamed protein product [Mytilus coruscus]